MFQYSVEKAYEVPRYLNMDGTPCVLRNQINQSTYPCCQRSIFNVRICSLMLQRVAFLLHVI